MLILLKILIALRVERYRRSGKVGKKFHLAAGKSVRFLYPLRVVTAGDFVMPGSTVEAMYAPDIHALTAPERIKVEN